MKTENKIPFSNGLEAMSWERRNCDKCITKTGCYGRKQIQLGCISGGITKKAYDYIGFNPTQIVDCQWKNKRVITKKKKKVNELPKLF